MPQPCHLYLGSLEVLYDLLPEPPVSTEIVEKEHRGSCSGLRGDFLQGSVRDFEWGTVDNDDEKNPKQM